MLDGEWSNWSEWDNCTLECGGGNQTRTRTCTNPEPQFNGTDCIGENSETQICNEDPCPIGIFSSITFFIVEDVAKISTNKLSTFDFFNFYFTTCFNPKQGPLQVSLHFELT